MTLYRLLLRLYPASFRENYGDELCAVFARQRAAATGWPARIWLWLAAIGDVGMNAARVHADILRQDLRHSARTLRRSPAFSVTAILVIALGVGATTAAFTLTDYVLLRPLPFPESDQLVKVWQGPPDRPATVHGLGGTNDVSPALYSGWKDLTTSSFASMGAYAIVTANLVGSGEPERLDGANVTYDALPTVGIPPAMGRPFQIEDDRQGAACVVLISDALWRQHFGADRSVLGTRIRLDDENCEIAGVMPPRFEFPSRTTQFWRPTRFAPEALADFTDNFLRVIARLKPGVSFEQGRGALASAAAEIARTNSTERADVSAVMLALRDELNDQSRVLLLVMAAAAGCLLLIACTNLASLTIARATTRARELAVRTALGAGRRRLIRQWMTESVFLAIIGGGLGLAIAIGAIPTAIRLVPSTLPIAEVPSVDWRMLAIAAFATLGTGIGFGVLPAIRAAGRPAANDIREAARSSASRGATRLRGALVSTQVAASIVLLVGAGLLIRALDRVQATPSGFDASDVLTMRTVLPWSKYGDQATRTAFYQRVLGDMPSVPGVKAVAYTSYLPMTFRGGVWPVVVQGRPVDPRRGDTASSRFVTPRYFSAMGIAIVAGRPFDDHDTDKAQPIAIVSTSFVTSYLSGSDAIGRTFTFGPAGQRSIVGVVGDVRVRGLERTSEPQVYLPYTQQGDNQTMGYTPKDLVVRFEPGADDAKMLAAVPAIRRIVAGADPNQPIADIQPLAAIVDGETAMRVVQVRVLGAFAAVSCILAAVGLHGLLAFVVSARTREFGVRLALGARPRQILGLVAVRGVALGLAGAAAGLLVAWNASQWLDSLLAGISRTDALTLAVAAGLSLAITIVGSLPPAIRAARTNPRDAIACE
ncbi:MAG TPA: ABC transporter permease [Vicinamibacterales bacterium]|nr:ABC transporter permease [Vicinamibacterales bacterium]